jgi:hypothetical protein
MPFTNKGDKPTNPEKHSCQIPLYQSQIINHNI